ncbi:MAG: cytidylyltransferase [Candidatus Omnitrophota bacterium]|nr:MAG: cytidylyltransferase [Candidatus Omnitrophota bacterium]
MIIAILMGRKGSVGFPGKNVYSVLGRPLAHYPMRAAKNCPEIDRIYLSTDDRQLAKLAKASGVEVIKRPPKLCTDKALGEDVYLHAYNYAKKKNKVQKIDQVILLMCNAATIMSATISKGIKILKKHPNYDSCVTVSKYNMWSPLRARKIDSDNLLKPFIPLELFAGSKKLNCDRDSQGDVWFADMGVSIVRPRCLENIKAGLLPQKWMGQRIYPLKQDGGLDVDYEWQIPQIEYWLREHGISGINKE